MTLDLSPNAVLPAWVWLTALFAVAVLVWAFLELVWERLARKREDGDRERRLAAITGSSLRKWRS